MSEVAFTEFLKDIVPLTDMFKKAHYDKVGLAAAAITALFR